MDDKQIVTVSVALVIAIIGYFIKGLISDLKKLEAKYIDLSVKMGAMSSDMSGLGRNLDRIFDAITEMRADIKHLNEK